MNQPLRSLLEKETRERVAELAEVTDKLEKENADLRDRLGKEEAGREADVKALQVRLLLAQGPPIQASLWATLHCKDCHSKCSKGRK